MEPERLAVGSMVRIEPTMETRPLVATLNDYTKVVPARNSMLPAPATIASLKFRLMNGLLGLTVVLLTGSVETSNGAAVSGLVVGGVTGVGVVVPPPVVTEPGEG